jgi:Mechanosensitive ion channel, conserved TM helix
MNEFLQLILEPMKDVFVKFKEFAPNLLAMMTIILVGILFARIMKAVLLRFMRAIKFDTWSDRMGLTVVMRKSDLWSKPSDAVGSIVFWGLIIGSLMAGLSSLKIHAIDSLVASFVLYVPRAFSAVLILIFGYIIAGFIGRAVLIAAVNSGYHYAKLLAEAVRLLLTVLILAMALEQLQVAPGIVVAAFSIIFGGIILALAISFGVGGIDAARKMIEKEDERKDEKKDIQHM